MDQALAHKAVRNSFFNGASIAAPLLAGICKSAIIARHLGPVRMGVYGYAMWIAGGLALVASLGLPTALTKYVSEHIGRGEHAQAARLCRRLVQLQFKATLAVTIPAILASLLFARGPEG